MFGKEDRQADVSFTEQSNTVHVNSRHEAIISRGDKTVLVFDDFTTSGMTLEWARNLLYSAGANRVVLLTVGKCPPWTCSLFTPVEEGIVTPFEHKIYNDLFDFQRVSLSMNRDAAAPSLVRTSFECYTQGQEFPSKAA